MHSTRFANVFTNEGAVSGTSTITLPFSSGKIIITNDSANKDLTVRLKTGANALTLKPTETLTLYYRTLEVVLAGSASVPYRLWVFS